MLVHLDVSRRILSAFDSGALKVRLVGGSPGCSHYLAADLARHASMPVVLVVSTPAVAEDMAGDLEFILGQDRVFTLLGDERGPYSSAASNRYLEYSRLSAMTRLLDPRPGSVLVCDPAGLARATVPKRLFRDACLEVKLGSEIDRDELVSRLAFLGYAKRNLVEAPGEFSARGMVVDVFSPSRSMPVRLVFEFDAVADMREFDPLDQRSISTTDKVVLCPASESALGDPGSAARQVVRIGDEVEAPTRKVRALADAIKSGVAEMDRDKLLPAYFDSPGRVKDYLPEDSLVVMADPVALEQESHRRWDALEKDFERKVATKAIVLDPCAYELEPQALFDCLGRFKQVNVMDLVMNAAFASGGAEIEWDASASASSSSHPIVASLEERLQDASEKMRSFMGHGGTVLVVCSSKSRASAVSRSLCDRRVNATQVEPSRIHGEILQNLGPAVLVTNAKLKTGIETSNSKAWVVTEQELFGRAEVRRPSQTRLRKLKDVASIRSFKDLKPGDLVVHVDYGIAKYQGLRRMVVQGMQGDFLELGFAGRDTLFLPIHAMSRVQKYLGGGGKGPALSRLGSNSWSKTKARVEEAVKEMARELIAVQAARKARPGIAYPAQDSFMAELEATFGYEETEDQAKAIEETLADMRSDKPMDRVVCGDVGFGKTEVAVRAAFQAVLGGKQVALLAPTTILAQQHGITFRERFRTLPVNVEVLSRFRSKAEQRSILERTARGDVDILIGTHRLLSNDVRFRDLGLLIVDEEHRFGVAHKEVLKKKRTQVDVLTLTATPIPRTLYMGLSGLMDMSLITTPPLDRQALETVVMRFDSEAVRKAVLAELSRDGQVFFVHNRVRSLPSVTKMVRELVPEARVASAHGQMGERDLERVMLDFLDKRFDVLVCTSIVESGLDIPSVNTMIVNRADMFGLSQLYQLRGRIGRGDRKGYCYLLVPPASVLSREARERLSVLQRFSDLGAGFQIAVHDLETRGAGNLLGAEQSGHVASVGMELYSQMLERAVRDIKGEGLYEEVEPELLLPVTALVPDDYVQDTGSRLEIYKKLAKAGDDEELDLARQEIRDRFGPLPDELNTLLRVMEIRIRLKRLNAKGLKVGGGHIAVDLGPRARLEPDRLVSLLARKTRNYTLTPDHVISRPLSGPERRDVLSAASNVLFDLERCAADQPGPG